MRGRAHHPALAVRCDDCGAPAGEACRSPADKWTPHHACRIRATERISPDAGRPRSQGVDLTPILAGRKIAQELVVRGDQLDAWRVAVACACLARIPPTPATPTVIALLTAYPTPVQMLLTPRELLCRRLAPLGLISRRAAMILRLSTAQAHDRCVESIGGRYMRECIALIVSHDVVTVPHDRVLRAVRSRMLSLPFASAFVSKSEAPCASIVNTNSAPTLPG